MEASKSRIGCVYRLTCRRYCHALLAVLALGGFSAFASADTYVNGYYRNDGAYVAPHYRSSPNGSTFDNYSTRGNTNPYTGDRGYVNPYQYSPPTMDYLNRRHYNQEMDQ
ncbi:MAG: hypothetical protein ACRED2_12560 [Methylocella sp.]